MAFAKRKAHGAGQQVGRPQDAIAVATASDASGISGNRSRADRRRTIGALPHGVGAGGGVRVADADAGAGFAIAVATDAGIGGAFVDLQFNGVTAAGQRLAVQVRQHTDVHGTFDHVGIGLGAVHGVTNTVTAGGSRTIVVPGR